MPDEQDGTRQPSANPETALDLTVMDLKGRSFDLKPNELKAAERVRDLAAINVPVRVVALIIRAYKQGPQAARG